MEPQNSAAHSSGDNPDAPNSVWRNEVHARVAGYRTRRGRRIEGAFSMRFPFPPADAASMEAADPPGVTEDQASLPASTDSECEVESRWPEDAAALEFDENAGSAAPTGISPEASAPDRLQEPPETEMPRPAARRSRRKVIAFPKPAAAPSHDWDEPLLSEKPRILDVADEFPALPATPLLDGLVFPSHDAHAAAASADHVELPLQAVPIGQRLHAGAVDCALVATAAAVFIAAGYKLMAKITLGKPLVLGIATIPFLLWATYQYLFLVYGGKTPGMLWAGIRLSSFKGGFPTKRQRRSRVVALYFSTASLMMGLLWALVDVDALCWHDRISRTYLTKGSN